MAKPVPAKGATRDQKRLAARIDRILDDRFPGHDTVALRLVLEAHRRDRPVSAILAFCEQESGFRNVFGRDVTSSGRVSGIPARWAGKRVTKWRYRWYRVRRRVLGAQGVGPMQLTYPGYQQEAERDGGCWRTSVNIATGVRIIDALWRQYGSLPRAAAAYNSGNAALDGPGGRYAREVTAKQTRWHRDLH